MRDITCETKMLLAVHWRVLLVLAVFCVNLCSCSNKSSVTYLPPKERDTPSQQQLRNKETTESLRKYYTSWKGTRYRYGGLSRKGVDCSGFTLLTYRELFGMNLPRTVKEQVKQGKKVQRSSLQAGDLVFFKTGIFQKHVGIYLENDSFMHASRSSGVMISQLDNVYWNKRYWQAKRL